MALRKSSEVQDLRDKITLKEGMRAGNLTLMYPVGSGWHCKCDCGNEIDVTRAYRLKNEIIGNVQDHVGSCGCKQKKTFKSANREGTIQSKYVEKTYGGAKILYTTDYIDSNRSAIVMCECAVCSKPFPTSVRHGGTTCGCTRGVNPPSLEEYLTKNNCKSKGEQKIFDILTNLKIPFVHEKKFEECRDQAPLPFDFYLESPKYGKYCIEYDGEQHFKSNNFFGGAEGFKNRRKHDLLKNRFCWKNDIKLIRIPADKEFEQNDLSIKDTRFELTKDNEQAYYSERIS